MGGGKFWIPCQYVLSLSLYALFLSACFFYALFSPCFFSALSPLCVSSLLSLLFVFLLRSLCSVSVCVFPLCGLPRPPISASVEQQGESGFTGERVHELLQRMWLSEGRYFAFINESWCPDDFRSQHDRNGNGNGSNAPTLTGLLIITCSCSCSLDKSKNMR